MTNLFRGIRLSVISKHLRAMPKRQMGGPGGGDHFHVSPWHSQTATALGTLMWLWVFYRTKQDGAVLLGFVHPWDNHHGGHDDHHGHNDGPYQYEHKIGSTPTLME